LIASFDYIQIYDKTSDTLWYTWAWSQNAKTVRYIEWRRTKALGIRMRHRKQRPTAFAGYRVDCCSVRKQVHRVESRTEYYWELRS